MRRHHPRPLQVWDLETGNQEYSMRGHTNGITNAADRAASRNRGNRGAANGTVATTGPGAGCQVAPTAPPDHTSPG